MYKNRKDINKLEQRANNLLGISHKSKHKKKLKIAKQPKFKMPKEVKEFYKDFYSRLKDL